MLASSSGSDGCLQLLIAAQVDLEAKSRVSGCMQVRSFVNASGSVGGWMGEGREVFR